MTLDPGTKLGPYEIVRPLGAGGMGEVYLARDTRLDRTVAVKVLPRHLSDSQELRQRFEREARAASSLNHPHICTLHDIGTQDGTDYIVMEHLEGETLAARLKRGPLPSDEALRIASQIADALDKAHRQGLIHRDLKPGNVMLTKGGAKLLDFGLAKSAGSPSGASPMTSAPTMTSPLTAEGVIVGTFQYMAPEQLEGAEASPRSDIFAFGATLYEMVTGQRAFEGKTQASLVAAILKEQPRAMSAIQPLAPPALERLVQTCMEKDPDERRQSMHDVLLELRWIAEGGSQAGVPAPAQARRRSRERTAWLVAAALGVSAIILAALLAFRPSAAPAGAMHVNLAPPGGMRIGYRDGALSLSPDGTMVVFVIEDEQGDSSLWLRSLDSPTGRVLEGTSGAFFPFWSPDSRSIAFAADGKLKRIAVAGGPPDTICATESFAGGSWRADGTILFGMGWGRGLATVPASGGTPQTLIAPKKEHAIFAQRWPQFLPDGRHFLFASRSGAAAGNTLSIGSIDGGEPKLIMDSVSNALYDPSGYLLFWREDAIRARPFDPERMEFTGEAILVAPGARFEPDNGLLLASISRTGLLAYVQGSGALAKSRLVLRDRSGREIRTVGETANYYSPRISHDGKRIAVDMSDETNNGDVWIHDLTRPVATRLTNSPVDESSPIWAPDDRKILITSAAKSAADIYLIDLASPAEQKPFYANETQAEPTDWSGNGKTVIFTVLDGDKSDIWTISVDGAKAEPFLATPFVEASGHLSPDGRWLAYDSNQSGRKEVYVTPFPGPGPSRQISFDGGLGARWRADGKEIFYLKPDGTVMAAEVTNGESIEIGAPQKLFKANIRWKSSDNWDAAPDGQSFLMDEAIAEESDQRISLILDWTAGVEKH